MTRWVNYLTIILILVSGFVQAQEPELIKFNELKYTSSFEADVFESLEQKKEVPALKMFLASGNATSENEVVKLTNQFSAFLLQFKTPRYQAYKNAKKIKLLTEAVAKSYLLRNVESANFESLLQQKEFNAFTQLLLYTLCFEDLAIPYSIRQTESGIDIIAYPASDYILLGSLQAFQFADDFKSKYIAELVDRKVITQQEKETISTKILFDKYYYKGTPELSLRKLTALQYNFLGMELASEENFPASSAAFEKSYYLDPNLSCGYDLLTTRSNWLQKLTTHDSIKASLLGQFSRFGDFGIRKEMILNDLSVIINELVFQKGKKPEMDEFFRIFSTNIASESDLKFFQFAYNYELTRYFGMLNKWKQAREHAFKSMEADPTNATMQTFYVNLLRQGITVERQYQNYGIEEIERSLEIFPPLRENTAFLQLYCESGYMRAGDLFNDGKEKPATEILNKIAVILAKHQDVICETDFVVYCYSSAAEFYFKRGLKAKAKEYALKGLELVPESYLLKARLSRLK